MAKINTLNYQTVASWNGSQDLFVVEQPDGTKVATPEQIKQYVLNDMDNVPTQNSNNPVKSGGIYSKIGNLTQTGLTGDSVAAQLATAKNQIAGISTKASGVITANSGFNVRAYQLTKVNGIVYGSFAINATNTISGRTMIGTIPSGFRPLIPKTFFCPASTGINYFQDRATNVIINETGTIVVGDLIVPSGQAIKEVWCAFAYEQAN